MQTLTEELWSELRRVNKEVNKDITYEVDATLHEKVDYWTVVDGKGRGDCDDYALTKIKRLVEETEWDRENLSIGVCYVEDSRGRAGKGEGHAVAIARTDRGDFVLDNRHKDVKAYDELPYRWIFMEDYTNKRWVRIVK
jgi:predicted transglutaminase-like cysteine proteinase